MKKNLRLFLAMLFSTALTVSQAQNKNWIELGSSDNFLNYTLNGFVTSICSDSSGNVYATGSFFNSNFHSYIAKWNGKSWSEVGSDYFSKGVVNSICTDKDGNLYAAGGFTDDDNHSYVAKWDGTSWTALGTGDNALAASNDIKYITADFAGNIYAAGKFMSEDGHYYVAVWDGTSWSALGGTKGLGTNGWIDLMYMANNSNLYVMMANSHFHMWDGNTWSEIGVESRDSVFFDSGSVNSFGVQPDGTIYASDAHQYAPDNHFNVIRWNGTYWSRIPAPGTLTPYVHVDYYGNVYGSNLYNNKAQYNFMKYNGKTWDQLGSINASGGASVLYSDKKGNLFAGGLFSDAGGKNYVAEYAASTSTAVVKGSYSSNGIRIAPSLVEDKMSVELPQNLVGTSYTIYNSTASPISTGVFQKTGNSLDLQQLAPGMYFMQLGDASGNAFKFVKN